MLIKDAQAPMLMITNGSVPSQHYEATLWFDGDDRDYTLAETAQYVGLIQGLTEAVSQRIKRLLVHGDSELVIRQMTGEYRCTADRIVDWQIGTLHVTSAFDFLQQGVSLVQCDRD
eukprot:gene21661-28029_t